MVLNETSYFGAGCRSAIADEIKNRGFKKVLVVVDPNLLKPEVGVAKKVTDVLDKAGIKYEVFSKLKANPTVTNVKDGVKAFKAAKADCLVAIGGGSSMDTAKGISIVIANPKFADVCSLEGVAATKNRGVPIIALPTTAGTAAEVTINYVITDEKNRKKMVCVDPKDIPIVAAVDAELMVGLPKGFTAGTGMDALTHAIEGYITKAAWTMTDMMHLEAIRLISTHLRAAVKNGKDMKAREGMALAQYIAGMGFSNVGLGIVHSMAHPLGAFYDTPHGIANALLLPFVMEYNAKAAKQKYRAIAEAMGVDTTGMTVGQAAKAAIGAVRQLSLDVGIPQKLHLIGVKKEDLQALSECAFKDVCTGGNPRDTNPAEILAVYKKAF
jgi:lactaldehyde reductase